METQTLNLPLPVLALSDAQLEELIEERNHYAESDDFDYSDLY